MFCRSLLAITLVASSAAAATVAAAAAGPPGCVVFDSNWNLLAFGFNGKDYSAGTQDTWSSSGSATDITTSNRPPFNSVNTTCYLSQFTNAIYILNADTANPNSIYIYDATKKSWSTQSVTIATSTTGTYDPSNSAAILDHDTNVFYFYSDGSLFSLDMGLLTAANSTAIPLNPVQQADLSSSTAVYQPTMALAQNHIHFMGVPGLSAGSVKIFVIHFSYLQPDPQSMGTFPNTHGKTASFFREDVQHEYAFIPDDGSETFVINVERNDTKTLTGPPTNDPFATYSASTSALVQLTTSGKVSFLPYNPNTTTSGGTWSTISKLPVATFSTSNSNTSSSASGTATGATSSSTGSSSSGGSNGNSSSGIRAVGGASGMHLVVCMALAVLLGFVGLVL